MSNDLGSGNTVCSTLLLKCKLNPLPHPYSHECYTLQQLWYIFGVFS
jgi:hypothetical protein